MGMKEKPEKIRRILAQNIKKRRENLGLTQEQLAELTDLSIQTINTIEGCRMWISDKSITRLAKALEVDVFQLFMPHHLNITKLDAKQNAVLFEFWQKTKLAIEKMDFQIDKEFNEVLLYSKRCQSEEAPKTPKTIRVKRH